MQYSVFRIIELDCHATFDDIKGDNLIISFCFVSLPKLATTWPHVVIRRRTDEARSTMEKKQTLVLLTVCAGENPTAETFIRLSEKPQSENFF